jgi:hypothetical protein
MDNILAEIAIIRDVLSSSDRYPPCCLTVDQNGEIGCEVIGPLPEKEFLKKCMECRTRIEKILANFNLKNKSK